MTHPLLLLLFLLAYHQGRKVIKRDKSGLPSTMSRTAGLRRLVSSALRRQLPTSSSGGSIPHLFSSSSSSSIRYSRSSRSRSRWSSSSRRGGGEVAAFLTLSLPFAITSAPGIYYCYCYSSSCSSSSSYCCCCCCYYDYYYYYYHESTDLGHLLLLLSSSSASC